MGQERKYIKSERVEEKGDRGDQEKVEREDLNVGFWGERVWER